MGTRGVYGFEMEGKKKVAYKHYDSYPEGLGAEIIKQIKQLDWTQIDQYKQNIGRIKMVTQVKKPGPRLIKRYIRFADIYVSKQSLEDWYCLLRNLQGNILVYLTGEVEHMLDSKWEFKKPKPGEFGTWVEYGYVINFDDYTLDFYRPKNGYLQKVKGYNLNAIINADKDEIIKNMKKI
jgi:hypothetical protein